MRPQSHRPRVVQHLSETNKIEMNYSKEEIAKLFSNGKFDRIMDYLSDEIIWNIIGENIFNGKKAVGKNCKQTAEYFRSIETDFKTDDVISSNNNVIVTGTAEFKRDGKRVNFISACDVYSFNDKNQIEKIASYCISEQRN